MLDRLDGCTRDPSCARTTRENARRLKRRGEVKILAYDSKTAYALGSARGLTRVAWTVIDRGLPVVQCVDVDRAGTVLAGRAIRLRRLSPPIDRQGSCGPRGRPLPQRRPDRRVDAFRMTLPKIKIPLLAAAALALAAVAAAPA